jgi:hypothetical protein
MTRIQVVMLRVVKPIRRHIQPDIGTTPGYLMTWSTAARAPDATLA